MSEGYRIVLTASARRSLEWTLPEKVAAAAFEFIAGALRDSPRRVGKPLSGPLAGLYAARRGDYRVTYRIIDSRRVVEVITIVHGRDAYRT